MGRRMSTDVSHLWRVSLGLSVKCVPNSRFCFSIHKQAQFNACTKKFCVASWKSRPWSVPPSWLMTKENFNSRDGSSCLFSLSDRFYPVAGLWNECGAHKFCKLECAIKLRERPIWNPNFKLSQVWIGHREIETWICTNIYKYIHSLPLTLCKATLYSRVLYMIGLLFRWILFSAWFLQLQACHCSSSLSVSYCIAVIPGTHNYYICCRRSFDPYAWPSRNEPYCAVVWDTPKVGTICRHCCSSKGILSRNKNVSKCKCPWFFLPSNQESTSCYL